MPKPKWVREKYYAYSGNLPGVKISICKVYGRAKYAVYIDGDFKGVRNDPEDAKRFAEEEYLAHAAVAAERKSALAQHRDEGPAESADQQEGPGVPQSS